MKIAILGDKTNVLDEGAKNVATNLSSALEDSHQVSMVHQRSALKPGFLRRLRRFNPDIILSMHGPSPKTILLLAALKLFCKSAKTVTLATQPNGDDKLLKALRYLPPDLILCQSKRWKSKFEALNITTEILSNGVDLEKFQPRANDSDQINRLRDSLGIDKETKVALHIGPINTSRNLELLMQLQRQTDWQVVVAGSTTAPFVQSLYDTLIENNVITKVEYFPDISSLYCLADVYIFPVMDKSGSIELPLTVFEAMSCDRPVVTSRFRGLPDVLKEAPGLQFFDNYEELLNKLDTVKGKEGNRKIMMDYSWHKISDEMSRQLTKAILFCKR